MVQLDASMASDLWVFRIAADSQTFRKAAERLSVTQSAVTQRIQRLEARLGLKLFRRGERLLSLSPAGRLLFEATRNGFDDISEAIGRLRYNDVRATVRISCVPSLALEWLTPRLAGFIALHPTVQIEIFGETHEVDRTRMAAEGMNIAIRYGPEAPKGAIVAFRHSEMTMPVVSPRLKTQMLDLPAAERRILLLHDASPWERASSPTVEWDYWLEAHGVPWGASRQDLFFNLAQLAYRAAVDGLGVAMGRHLVVSRYLHDGLLVPALNETPLQVTALHVLVQALPAHGPTTLVLDWLKLQMATT